jgi:DNA polymerase elongation subunit (family B)
MIENLADNGNNKSDISFQILDWVDFNIEDILDESGSGEEDKGELKSIDKFGVRLFGLTDKNETVCCTVTDYSPYFYIKLENGLANNVRTVLDKIKERVWPKENIHGLKGWKVVKKYDFTEFSNFTKFDFLRLDFHNTNAMGSFARVLKKKLYIRNKRIKLKAFESNLLPTLRMMHIRKLSAVGWVKINKDKYSFCNPKTSSQINIQCSWTDLIALDEIKNQKFTIMSFDIECVSCDGSFPNPERETDRVIQIGLTMSRYGEDECYYKHIVTLGSCDPLEGIIVESYNTEKEVLLAFSKLVRKIDPDVITGYNINGFDFNYLNERAKLLGIAPQFSRMSRIKNQISEFVIKDLSSAALGENKLKFFDMKGRVILDLMKVIQRDHKLPSYKLDEVTSTFIREGIINITNDVSNNVSIIETKNTNGIYKDQYIRILYNDGMTENKHMDGKKFKVLELTKKSLTVDGNIETEEILNRGYKVFWCNAKDDIGPNDIFRMQDEGSYERSIIAKYCIQDCALCNKLIAKLQILTNNIGMANVCSVPLQFIFSRGQGIKIFSLVAKKCRDKDHLIPTLKVKPKPEDLKDGVAKITEVIQNTINNKYQKYEDDEDDEEGDTLGYEGATVFEPVTGVHYNPIYVLDFSSLYPSSMIMKNLSHEMFVNDPKYDNMKGYIYHEIEYKNSDNTMTKCKFAEKESGEKGIIPEILQELLGARKKFKKQMEKLKDEGGDPFIIAILDGLQQAYKVTANSLYGQTGAPTSSIFKKQIAASTTATGREMLQFAKYFNEITYAKMINLAKAGDFKSYYEYMKSLYEIYPNKIKVDDTTTVTVCSVDKRPIPLSKFFKGNLDYHILSEEKMLKSHQNALNSLNINNIDEYTNFLEKISVLEYKDIHNIIEFFKTCKKSSDLKIDIKFDKYKKLDQSLKEAFFKDIYWVLENYGYKNKDEMFLKFYNVVRHVLKDKEVNPVGIYGDTDSVFIKPNIKDIFSDEILKDKDSLKIAIKLGEWASILITCMLPPPESLEYEKVLWPFIIITKKRYVGNLYEKDPDSFKQKSMGIVLKRRDNAPVVKIVCGNIIDQILNKRDSKGAVDITHLLLKKIITGKMPLDKFIITKTLKFSYKKRTQIVHAVLADRMAERDPGNKPESNDRIPYVYYEVEDERTIKLQGDRVEHPDYLVQNKLKIDYLFYITNQIMKPCMQFLELIVEKPEKIFNDYIIREENRKMGKAPIEYYFQGSNKISTDEFTNILDEDYKIDRKDKSELKMDRKDKSELKKSSIKSSKKDNNSKLSNNNPVKKKIIKRIIRTIKVKKDDNNKKDNKKDDNEENNKKLDDDFFNVLE